MTLGNFGNCLFEDGNSRRGPYLQQEGYEFLFGYIEHEFLLRYSKANVKYGTEIMLLNLKGEIKARGPVCDKNNH